MKKIYFSIVCCFTILCFYATAQNPGGKMYFADVVAFNTPGPSQGVVRYFNCGNDPSVNITTSLTIELWVKPAIPTDNQKLIGKVDADGGASFNDGYMLGISNSRMNPEIWTPTNQNFQEGFIPPVSTWHHLAITYRVGGMYQAFLNGELVHEQAAVGGMIVNDDSDLVIGIAPWDLANFMTFGSIDEARIWNVIRSGDQIKENMFKNLTPGSGDGLVLYLNFDNDTGATVIEDLSTAENHCGKVNMDATNIIDSECIIGDATTQTMTDLNGIWFASDAFLQDPRYVETENGLTMSSFFNGQDSSAYIVWGHNNEGGVSTADLPSNAPAGAERTGRIWHTTVFGSISPYLTFDLNNAAGGGTALPTDKAADFYALLVRNENTGTFDFVAAADDKNGNEIVFELVSIEGAFYAVAVGDEPFSPNSIFDADRNDLALSVYPNPSNGQLNVQLMESVRQEVNLTVFNMMGQMVKSIQTFDQRIHLDLPQTGVYVLRIEANGKTANRRIVIEK